MFRKKAVLLPLVLVAVLLALIFSFLLLKEKKSISIVTSSFTTAGRTQMRSLRPLVMAPRLSAREKLTLSSQQEVSEECLDYWSNIERINMESIYQPPYLDRLPDSSRCIKFPPELNYVQGLYNEKCLPFSQKIPPERLTDCGFALFFLRAAISAWNHKEEKLAEITDLKLLTDKLFVGFSKMYSDKPNVQELKAVALRILEVDPHIYGAVKAVIIGHVVQGISDPSFKGTESYWIQMQPWLDQAREMNPSDPELIEMSRVLRTQGFEPNLMRQDAFAMTRAQPQSWEAFRYLAFAEWKLGHQDASRQFLQRAMELSPGNETLQKTLQEIESGHGSSDSFRMSISLGLRLDQILQ